MAESVRCAWSTSEPIYVAYHDEEWGVPERDGRALWEKLVLDGFQAGLSWITILKKREAFRKAFHGFDPEKVARFGAKDRARLMANAGIIRSNAKIDMAINGARLYLDIQQAGEDFSDWMWGFVDDKPIQTNLAKSSQIPAQTPLSVEVAKSLKAKGFKFTGPVIVYAWMQATGLVNDHLTCCFRHAEIARMGKPGGKKKR